MKFDVLGRISNMQLPDGRTALLYSIYEAISNAIQAAEERFGRADFTKRGVISILVEFNSDKSLRHVAISDNGIGLNPAHLEAFETCDTRQKYALGGKGVGRLVWIKVFSKINVLSVYEVGLDRCEQVSFTFDPTAENSLVNLKKEPGRVDDVGTKIVLAGIKADENAAISPNILTRNICHHFFPYFIAGSMPRLIVQFGRRNIDVVDYLSSKIDKQADETIDVSVGSVGAIQVDHVYVDKSISQNLSNSILLTAQGRVVQSVEIEKKFALKGLENGRAYVCVVKGDFLNARVDQERTGFKSLESEIEAIKESALEAAERFLEAHIKTVRAAQKTLVISLLEEHPQLAISVKDVNGYVASLSPSMAEEDIGKTLFTLLYRHERRVRSQISAITDQPSPIENEISREKIEALVNTVTDDAKRRLAEYTIKRHQVIQLARTLLRFKDDSSRNYYFESAVHNLICPMGKMLSSKDYEEHNLWLIDDLLSYYSFFASDKSMTSLGVDGERKEPDLIFLNPHGFRREGTNDPVVVIEFKRPGDEALSSDPVDQVLDYVERLRNKTVRDVEGAVVSDISDHTPFECIVVCDLTETARKKFTRSIAQTPTPDGMGYYGFSIPHRAAIRVLSYAKVFRDAEMRNRAFFDKLGLLPEEVRKALTDAVQAAE